MIFRETTALKKIIKLKKRIRFVNGGTGASKTISILMWLIDYCQSLKQEMVSVVSETLPHLKKGAIRDFVNIMTAHGYFQDNNWNKTDFIYTFKGGSKLEFFSADQPAKVRGPRRDVLFINEGNNIPFDVYTHLEVRTKKIIWVDSNPTHEYWMYTEVMPNNDIDFLTLTYLDNEGLDPNIIQSIESRRNNKNWWQVYGLGQLGELEGRIYKGWRIIDEVPHEARLERYGLDFGYSIDPAVIEAIYYYNGGYIIDEKLYQKGISNKVIADTLNNLDKALVIADSAEPKSIDEIRSYGINIIGSVKGQGSVSRGIDFVQSQRISITKNSVKTIKAYRNYLFKTDINGKVINVPDDTIHEWSNPMDCLTGDTLVKTIDGDRLVKDIKIGDLVYTRKGLKKVKDSWLVKKNANVIKISLSSGRKLIGTPKHQVWTKNRGWQCLTDIRYGDILEVWKEQENTKEENILYIPARENIISIMGLIFYIAKYGKIILEKFLMGFMFIIKMGINLIIELKILNSLIKEFTAKIIGKSENQLINNAIVVGEHSRVIPLEKRIDFAPTDARVNGEEVINLILSRKNVHFVANNLYQINTKIPHTVLESVVTKQGLKDKYTVYDITVEDCNEYFANDILVHNSIRYGMESLRPKDWETEKVLTPQERILVQIQKHASQEDKYDDGISI